MKQRIFANAAILATMCCSNSVDIKPAQAQSGLYRCFEQAAQTYSEPVSEQIRNYKSTQQGYAFNIPSNFRVVGSEAVHGVYVFDPVTYGESKCIAEGGWPRNSFPEGIHLTFEKDFFAYETPEGYYQGQADIFGRKNITEPRSISVTNGSGVIYTVKHRDGDIYTMFISKSSTTDNFVLIYFLRNDEFRQNRGLDKAFNMIIQTFQFAR